MMSYVIISVLYVALIVLVLGDRVDLKVALIVAFMVQIAANVAYSSTLFRHQKLLEWFRNHIRLERSRLPDDAPDDLGGEEDDN